MALIYMLEMTPYRTKIHAAMQIQPVQVFTLVVGWLVLTLECGEQAAMLLTFAVLKHTLGVQTVTKAKLMKVVQ